MGRKRFNPDAVLSDAEKSKRYRDKRRAEIAALKAAQNPAAGEATPPDMAALREQVKTELRKSWEPELKAERISAERKKGRELAKKADQNYDRGHTVGICKAAGFFIGKDRADIAQSLLTHFSIDRETAEAALQADRRIKNLTLESLDKAGAWGKPPKVIK